MLRITLQRQSPNLRQISLRWMQSSHRNENPTNKVPGWGKTLLSKMFGKYLLTTNILSSGILMLVGDFISQEIEYHRGLSTKRHEFSRMWRMFIVGSVLGMPHHFFYKWLDKVMPVANVKTSFYKILLDQAFMSPFDILVFLYLASFLERSTLKEANEEARNKFFKIYLVDCTLWPPVQFINFYFLAPKYRVFYLNTITTLYNVFLSFTKYQT